MAKIVTSGLASAAILTSTTPALAQAQSLTSAISFMLSGWGAFLALCAVAYLIGKQQFPKEAGWVLVVMAVVVCYFAGLGGMDWWTFGEWQGMPWENSGGSMGRRFPGNRGW